MIERPSARRSRPRFSLAKAMAIAAVAVVASTLAVARGRAWGDASRMLDPLIDLGLLAAAVLVPILLLERVASRARVRRDARTD